MNKIYILHLINGLSVFGAERVAMELAQQSAKKGDCVTIGLINGDAQMLTDILNRLQGTNVGVECFATSGKLSVCFRLLAYCRKQNITIIHSHGYKSNLLALLVKIVMWRVKLVATNHNYITNTPRQRFYRWLDLRILTFYAAIVAVSNDVKQNMVKGGFPADKIEIIDNGISISPVASANQKKQLLKELELSSKNIYIGIVASLTPEKGHRVLLDAFSQLISQYPYCRLIIVGDGPLRDDLCTYRDDLNITTFVHFMGYRDDSQQIMNTFDFFVLPSLREGLPLVLLEAMSIAIPVVATRVGAIPKVVKDSVSGFLIDPDCVDQLSKAMKQMVENEELRKTLGKVGQQVVISNYSSKQMAENYYKIYDGVIK